MCDKMKALFKKMCNVFIVLRINFFAAVAAELTG